jgi:hypothetical protein
VTRLRGLNGNFRARSNTPKPFSLHTVLSAYEVQKEMGMQIDRNRSEHFGLSAGRKPEQEEVRIQVARRPQAGTGEPAAD